MHWSNNCSNPFSYGYNSTLESRIDCPNYNSFNDPFICQQGNNSKSLSLVNSLTTKYNTDASAGSAYNKFSNLQSANKIKMWTELDPQTKAAAEASWGIVFPMSVQSNTNSKLQWSYDVMNSTKGLNTPDRDNCIPSDKFNTNNGLYSPNDFMPSPNVKPDLNGFNQSKGLMRTSQIKPFNNTNNESYQHLTALSVNPLNIGPLEQSLSNVSLSSDSSHFNTFPNATTNNQAPSPSKKTWALIVGKKDKPSTLSFSNFSMRTNKTESNMKPKQQQQQQSIDSNANTNPIGGVNSKINLNLSDFDCNVKSAKFFVIKSYSEDDVYRSIKYQIWCSTETGNRRLDNAYAQCNADTPIYLFFSVNGSGHFCGVAEMVSPVDYKTRASVWAQGKWKGQFRVRWVFVKDVPNSQLRHIRIETNENKPVTNSRDVTEIPCDKGRQVLKIIANFKASSSIYDDFDHYEQRELSESTNQ